MRRRSRVGSRRPPEWWFLAGRGWPRARTLAPASGLALAILLAAGCSPSGVATTAPSARQDPVRVSAVHAPTAVVQLVGGLARSYQSANWTGIRQSISDRLTAGALVERMRRWRAEGVSPLHVDLVYSRKVATNRYVATVEFSSDPRTTPAFSIFILQLQRGSTRIIGTASGVQGADLTHANWSVTRSAHFVIYHSPYQLAGSDAGYLQGLEYQRAQFMRKFGVKVADRVAYYFFPTQEMMSQMTGQTCGSNPENVGCAQPFTNPPSVQATIWPTYHEPIHVYQRALEPPPRRGGVFYVAPLFIAEGMAVALEDREVDPSLSDYCSDLKYAPLDTCARIAISHIKPLSLLTDSGFKSSDPGYAYSLGGSFVKYLILRSGYRTFGRFYYKLAAQPYDRELDYNTATYAIYHRSIRQLIADWSTALCRPGC